MLWGFLKLQSELLKNYFKEQNFDPKNTSFTTTYDNVTFKIFSDEEQKLDQVRFSQYEFAN